MPDNTKDANGKRFKSLLIKLSQVPSVHSYSIGHPGIASYPEKGYKVITF